MGDNYANAIWGAVLLDGGSDLFDDLSQYGGQDNQETMQMDDFAENIINSTENFLTSSLENMTGNYFSLSNSQDLEESTMLTSSSDLAAGSIQSPSVDLTISSISQLSIAQNTNATQPTTQPQNLGHLEACILRPTFHKYEGLNREITRERTNVLLTVRLPDPFITQITQLYGSRPIWIQLVEPTIPGSFGSTSITQQNEVVLKLHLRVTSSRGKPLPHITDLIGFAQPKNPRGKRTSRTAESATDMVQIDPTTKTAIFRLRFLCRPSKLDKTDKDDNEKRKGDIWHLEASCECTPASYATHLPFGSNNLSRPYEIIFYNSANDPNQIAKRNQKTTSTGRSKKTANAKKENKNKFKNDESDESNPATPMSATNSPSSPATAWGTPEYSFYPLAENNHVDLNQTVLDITSTTTTTTGMYIPKIHLENDTTSYPIQKQMLANIQSNLDLGCQCVTDIVPTIWADLNQIEKCMVQVVLRGENMPAPVQILFDNTIVNEIVPRNVEAQKWAKTCVVPSLSNVIVDRLKRDNRKALNDTRVCGYLMMNDYTVTVSVCDSNNRCVPNAQAFTYLSEKLFVDSIRNYFEEDFGNNNGDRKGGGPKRGGRGGGRGGKSKRVGSPYSRFGTGGGGLSDSVIDHNNLNDDNMDDDGNFDDDDDYSDGDDDDTNHTQFIHALKYSEQNEYCENDFIKSLLNQKYVAKLFDDFGRTLLHYTCWKGWEDASIMLIAAGCDVNKIDKFGVTALHFAAWKGYLQLVVILLSAKANPSLKDFNDVSPIDITKTMCDFEMFKYMDFVQNRNNNSSESLNTSEVTIQVTKPVSCGLEDSSFDDLHSSTVKDTLGDSDIDGSLWKSFGDNTMNMNSSDVGGLGDSVCDDWSGKPPASMSDKVSQVDKDNVKTKLVVPGGEGKVSPMDDSVGAPDTVF